MEHAKCPICLNHRPPFFKSELPYCARSDWQPVQTSMTLFYCESCHHFFKLAEFVEKWSDYENYHAFGSGLESEKYDPGWPQHRANKLLNFLEKENLFKEGYKALDFGCNQGQLLARLPGKNHIGLDLSPNYRYAVESLGHTYFENVEDLKSESVDVIFLIHVFEHLDNPLVLKPVLRTLKPGGKVVIQVPDPIHHALDFYVCDHRSHFTIESLTLATSQLNLKPTLPIQNIVGGELTAILEVGPGQADPANKCDLWGIKNQLEIAEKKIVEVQKGKQKRTLFGTGYMGLMLAKIWGSQVSEFIDDNPLLHGRSFFDKPIVPIHMASRENEWVLCVPPVSNQAVVKRCAKLNQPIKVLFPEKM